MSNPLSVERMGNDLVIRMDDGTRFRALDTGGELWIAQRFDPPAPDPGPTPTPPPASGGIRWPFNPRTFTTYPGHKGLDSPQPYGTPIPCAAAGKVVAVNKTDTYGNGWGLYVRVDHGNLLGDGKNITTAYCHMNPPGAIVNQGQTVAKGQTLGPVGNTGKSYGAHLHFEIWVNGSRLLDNGVRSFMNQHADGWS